MNTTHNSAHAARCAAPRGACRQHARFQSSVSYFCPADALRPFFLRGESAESRAPISSRKARANASRTSSK